mmetsp:Transcript_40529/g.88946  ORF Transcript_40529/g.88946 Transcript_40529/m.88946 type:complete len:259 (-) Transcript_40529:1183-1959(-)
MPHPRRVVILSLVQKRLTFGALQDICWRLEQKTSSLCTFSTAASCNHIQYFCLHTKLPTISTSPPQTRLHFFPFPADAARFASCSSVADMHGMNPLSSTAISGLVVNGLPPLSTSLIGASAHCETPKDATSPISVDANASGRSAKLTFTDLVVPGSTVPLIGSTENPLRCASSERPSKENSSGAVFTSSDTGFTWPTAICAVPTPCGPSGTSSTSITSASPPSVSSNIVLPVAALSHIPSARSFAEICAGDSTKPAAS